MALQSDGIAIAVCHARDTGTTSDKARYKSVDSHDHPSTVSTNGFPQYRLRLLHCVYYQQCGFGLELYTGCTLRYVTVKAAHLDMLSLTKKHRLAACHLKKSLENLAVKLRST